jgi:putative FmdB family regulatory protein
MPFYEFYCKECNTIFTFFSKRVNTEKIPDCPKCKSKTLQRMISLFAIANKSKKTTDILKDNPLDNLPINEEKMTKAIESLASEAENINDEDPRQAAHLMKKFSQMTGLEYSDKIKEAINRLESGENPDDIEASLGDALETEEPFILPDKKDASKNFSLRKNKLVRDDTIYDLE